MPGIIKEVWAIMYDFGFFVSFLLGLLFAFLCLNPEVLVGLNNRKTEVSCIFLFLALFMFAVAYYCTSLVGEAKEKEEQEQYPEQKLSLVYEDVYDHMGINIVRDNETGILYLTKGDAITPLLDADGNPRKEYSEEDVQRAITDVEK